MLAKKSAFDILMGKFKPKEEKAQDSDSDLSVIEVIIDKKENNHNQTLNNKPQISKVLTDNNSKQISANINYKEPSSTGPEIKNDHVNQLNGWLICYFID